jgi:hypothetical protein
MGFRTDLDVMEKKRSLLPRIEPRLFGRPALSLVAIQTGLSQLKVMIVFKYVYYEGVDWIHLAEGRDKWRAFENKVMNLRVP